MPVNPKDLTSAAAVRAAARCGALKHPTSGLANDCVQANVVILPREVAFEFLLFCQRNPAPCPLVEVLEAGEIEAKTTAPGSDVRTDVPRYHVYSHGARSGEQLDLLDRWRDDFVTFLLGCSFTFEQHLAQNGIHLPYFGTDKGVSMFKTNIDTRRAGPFHGPLVVSQRWVPKAKVDWVIEATRALPLAHGAPVHVGDPAKLGIRDLSQPDFGDSWPPHEDSDVPVFWACGVTPQAVAVSSQTSLMITHAPGHMFVTDLTHRELIDS